jgi:hypothetical protein
MADLIGALISAGLPLAEKIFGAAARAKTLNLSFAAQMRALYFEVTTNLRTLDVIDAGKLSPRNLAALAASLEIETSAAILFSDDTGNDKTRNFLAIQGKVEEENEEVEKPAGKKQKTVLRALLFIVQRVVALQKIAAVYSSEDSILTGVRVPVRINNIKQHLVFVKKKLWEFNKTEHFLFEEQPN